MAARKIKAKAQMIAAYKLEVHEDDLEWDIDGFRVKGLPEKTMSMKDICWAAYNSVPPGMEPNCTPPSRCPSSRSEEHTSELQSHLNLVCRLLLEKKKKR